MDAEPVWMAADNRIRELALSIERRAGIALDADGLRQIREWATEIVCQCDMVERVQEQAEPTWKSAHDREGWVIDGYEEWDNPNVTAWMPLPDPYMPAIEQEPV